MKKSLEELWIDHRNTNNSIVKNESINKISMPCLNMNINHCLDGYINQNHRLNLARRLILQKSKHELEAILPFVDEAAHDYWIRLHLMCCLALADRRTKH